MDNHVGVPAWLLAVLLAGCATGAAVPPPTGSMWAFFSDSDLVMGPGAVTYTISQVACEAERQRRLPVPPACIAVVVSPGTGYYAIALPSQFDTTLPGGGVGTRERDRCERVRMDLFRAYSARGDCQPVAVQRAR